MAMDDESFVVRWPRRSKPKDILATLSIAQPADYFTFHPSSFIPHPSPWDWSKPEYEDVKVAWREDLPELERRRLEAQMLPNVPYRERVDKAKRAEEVMDTVHDHIWDDGQCPPRHDVPSRSLSWSSNWASCDSAIGRCVADTFCGSGQIPFEAARLGCDVYASDLNPVACMLTWGAFNIVGGSTESREELAKGPTGTGSPRAGARSISLGVETDGHGWRAKVFLYCVEARCPQTGWMVPLLADADRQHGLRRGCRTCAGPDEQTVRDPDPHRSQCRQKSRPPQGRHGWPRGQVRRGVLDPQGRTASSTRRKFRRCEETTRSPTAQLAIACGFGRI